MNMIIVYYAQLANATAVIIGNNIPRQSLVRMSSELDLPITIPSVFVAYEAYQFLDAQINSSVVNVTMSDDDDDFSKKIKKF